MVGGSTGLHAAGTGAGGEGGRSARRDLYSVGVFTKLVGARPHTAGDRGAVDGAEARAGAILRLPAHCQWHLFDRALANRWRTLRRRQIHATGAVPYMPATGCAARWRACSCRFRVRTSTAGARLPSWSAVAALGSARCGGVSSENASTNDARVHHPATAAASVIRRWRPGGRSFVGEDSEPLLRPLPRIAGRTLAVRARFAVALGPPGLAVRRQRLPRQPVSRPGMPMPGTRAWPYAGGKLIDALSAQTLAALKDRELERAKDGDRRRGRPHRASRSRKPAAPRNACAASSGRVRHLGRDRASAAPRRRRRCNGCSPSPTPAPWRTRGSPSLAARVAHANAGDRLPDTIGGVLVQASDALVAVSRASVSRSTVLTWSSPRPPTAPHRCAAETPRCCAPAPRTWDARRFRADHRPGVVCACPGRRGSLRQMVPEAAATAIACRPPVARPAAARQRRRQTGGGMARCLRRRLRQRRMTSGRSWRGADGGVRRPDPFDAGSTAGDDDAAAVVASSTRPVSSPSWGCPHRCMAPPPRPPPVHRRTVHPCCRSG